MKYNNNNYKPRHEIPSPEEISADNKIACTLNINDTSNTLTQHPYYQALLQRMSEYCEIDMYYEYSKSFKLHCHGVIVFKEESNILPFVNLMNEDEVKQQFTYSIKNMFLPNKDDPDPVTTWYDYCIKQKHLSKPYLRKMNINYHTIINKQNPIGKVFNYISSSAQLRGELNQL